MFVYLVHICLVIQSWLGIRRPTKGTHEHHSVSDHRTERAGDYGRTLLHIRFLSQYPSSYQNTRILCLASSLTSQISHRSYLKAQNTPILTISRSLNFYALP